MKPFMDDDRKIILVAYLVLCSFVLVLASLFGIILWTLVEWVRG